MKIFFFLFSSVLLLPLNSNAQMLADTSAATVDSLYREDQFYLGFTYNILTDMPSNLSSSGFSGGLHLGFIRDFPINKRRNVAIGTGLGWSINSYGQTLFIGEEPNTEESIFLSLEDLDLNYDRNRFTTHSVEMPIQFRWRTSTA